jgi:hypothetical protein
MEIQVNVDNWYTKITFTKEGNPISPQNSIAPSELGKALEKVSFVGGDVAIIFGMPQWAVAAVAVKAKNLFSVIGVYDPKTFGAVVIHSLKSEYTTGNIIIL